MMDEPSGRDDKDEVRRMAEPHRKAALLTAGAGAALSWLGERPRYLAVGEQTLGRLAAAVQTLAPAAATVASVRQTDHEGLYVLSGRVSAAIGNRTVEVPAGGFLTVAPGTARRISNPGDEPAELLRLFAPAGFDEFQFRSGLPLAKPDEPPAPVTADDRAAAASLAAGYGLALEPPAAAFEVPPRFRLTLPGEGRALAVTGDVYRFLAVADDTDGRYAIWHATVPPGGGPPPHTHTREDEAFLVLKGSVAFRADGRETSLGPGGFAHLPSGGRHRFRNVTDEPAEMLILVAPAGLERMFETTGRPWHDLAANPGPPDHAEVERLIAAAPQFGIELHLGET